MNRIMNFIYLRRYQGMILFGISCFYLGCVISLTFISVDCESNVVPLVKHNDNMLKETVYAVLVLSSPKNEMQRDTIRTTWDNLISNIHVENGEMLYKWNYTLTGNKLKHQQLGVVKTYFAIGTQNLDTQILEQLNLEYTRTNDLLLLDNFEDSYSKLAAKMVISLEWLSQNLKNLKYVIKCDDDSFTRVDLIVADLEVYAPEMNGQAIHKFVSYKESLPKYKGLYWGYFNGRAQVYRRGKWQEKAWFLCNAYLPYALGGGYVISRSIVDYIAQNGDFLSKYNSEDVSMGVWTAALDGINRVHDTRFDTEWISRGCDDTMLIRHKQEHSDMVQMYSNLIKSKGTKLCTSDYAARKSYNYNWNSLPSSCCARTKEDLR